MVGFEKAAGWIFWTWRTESSPEWDFKALVEGGIIAQPLDAFGKYPDGVDDRNNNFASADRTSRDRPKHLRVRMHLAAHHLTTQPHDFYDLK
jgi:hypothetical protein